VFFLIFSSNCIYLVLKRYFLKHSTSCRHHCYTACALTVFISWFPRWASIRIFRMQKLITFSPLCRNYIHTPLPVLASAATRTGPVKTVCTGPQTQSPLIICLINTMGRRTSSGVCSNGPQVLDWSKQHAPFGHKPAHFTVCHAPGQTAQHQFMLNNSREENKDLSCLWTAKDGSSIPFFS